MRHLLTLALLLAASLPAAASAVSINFDESTAPCNFAQAPNLTTQYSSQGVTFSGGNWERLNECGNFSVSGYSSPNFVAWNTNITGSTETLTFSSDASSISFLIASNGGGTAVIRAYNAAGSLLQTVNRSMGSGAQTATVTATGVRTVTITVPSFSGVIDNLVFSLNNAPTADAGGPYTIGQGNSVSLNGSGSSDSDGSITLYEWDCTSNGSYDVSSSSPTASSCPYADDGSYTVTLRVTDNDGAQDTDTASVTVTNAAPTANAGGPYTVGQGISLTMNGSGSSDSDGSITLYEWDCTSNGSYDVNSGSASGSSCIYPDDGNYTVTLRVTDDDGAQATDTAAVTVTNDLPTANAGGPYTTNQGIAVSLNGSASSDSDGTIALYAWDCTSDGSYDTSSSSATAQSCLYPDDGSYTVTLQVTDDDGATATATATVTVTNTPPTANAGGPYTTNQGVPVALNGGGSSDADGTLSLYEWDCTDDGSYDVSSTSATGNTCTYDDGSFTVRLRVTDDDGATATATAAVTSLNTSPSADAGGPYTGTKNVAIAVDGSASSDPDGSIATWEWDCETDGTYEFSASTGTGTTCTYGAVGSYTVTLRVTDDDGAQATDSAAVTVGNDPPVADAGGPYTGDEAVAITVDGSGSTDAGGAIVTYEWDCDGDGTYEVSGSTATASCTYGGNGSFTVSLRVTDDDGAQATDSASVTISNTPPSLSSLVIPDGDEGSSLSFSVVATDVGGDVVTVTWDFGDGTTGTGDSTVHTYADDGVYTVSVSATDGDDTTTLGGTSTISNVAPVLSSSPGVNALEGSVYSYQPTVVDPGDEVFTYALSLSAPVGMTLDSATGLIEWTPTYDQSVIGSFSVVLTVDDGDGGTDQQSWTIAVLSLDTDGDGLPDAWEDANGLDPTDPNDANADPDGDGLSNLDEFGQGTDPNSYDGPSLPVAFSPLTGDEVSTDRPDLIVDNATDPQNDVLVYDFEVYEDAALTLLVTSMTSVVETASQTLWKVDLPLTENQMYWWRARVSDPFVSSAWITAESFVINEVNEAPDTPILTYPSGGETVTTLTPELVWSEVADIDGDAVTYDVEVYDATGALVDSEAGVLGDGTEARWTLTVALQEDSSYSWTARAVDEHLLAGDWATEETFFLSTDNAAPFGTLFLEPEDGSSIASPSPVLVASESVDPEGTALSYEFEVDVLPSFDSADLEEASLPGTGTGEVSWDLAADSIVLPDNTWVYARVRAVDAGGVASQPDTISFFVRGDNDAPNVPVLLAPEDGSTGISSPVFEVEDPIDPEGDVVFVEFLVARDADMTDILGQTAAGVLVTGEGRTSWESTSSFDGTLHWTARAIDADGAASEWAEPWTYTVEGSGSAGDDDDDDDDGAGGCDCASSMTGTASPSWLFLLLLLPALRRRRG